MAIIQRHHTGQSLCLLLFLLGMWACSEPTNTGSDGGTTADKGAAQSQVLTFTAINPQVIRVAEGQTSVAVSVFFDKKTETEISLEVKVKDSSIASIVGGNTIEVKADSDSLSFQVKGLKTGQSEVVVKFGESQVSVPISVR